MCMFARLRINRLKKKIKTLQSARLTTQPSDDVLKREITYYFELANLYQKVKKNKKYPYAELMIVECYRAAASLDDSSAHYQLGQLFLDEAKFRLNLREEGLFISPGGQSMEKRLFEEAAMHLFAAEKLGHIGAKRLRGLCLINGWGMAEDKSAGLELVISSIEQEGSWDRVPQIFASIGLNKPEFFAAIMQRKK